MSQESFEDIVYQSLDELPDKFKQLMDNIDIVVEDWPTKRQLHNLGLKNKQDLLGLYEGVPLTERTSNYNLVAPDRIYIFKNSLLLYCRSHNELKSEIRKVVRHEIAHYFGLDDARLHELEANY